MVLWLPWPAGSARPWAARILGADQNYGLSREWVSAVTDGAPGSIVGFDITTPGLYETAVSFGDFEFRCAFAMTEEQLRPVCHSEWVSVLRDVWNGAPFRVGNSAHFGVVWLEGNYGVSDRFFVGQNEWVVVAVIQKVKSGGSFPESSLVVALPAKHQLLPTQGDGP
jgi:hypothetical protein